MEALAVGEHQLYLCKSLTGVSNNTNLLLNRAYCSRCPTNSRPPTAGRPPLAARRPPLTARLQQAIDGRLPPPPLPGPDLTHDVRAHMHLRLAESYEQDLMYGLF